MSFIPSDAMNRLPTQFFAGLTRNVHRIVQAGHDVINVGQGNPDQPTPPHIVAAMQREAANPLHHKYSPFQGRDELKEAIAHWYKQERGVELDPYTEVAILFGGKVGLVELSNIFLNPGDVCLVPDPGYPDYWSGVAMAGGVMEMMPLRAENDFRPDFTKIAPDVADRAKMMFLNYPNNPTGAVATPELIEEAVRFCLDHNILLVHDYAYGTIGFDGVTPPSFLAHPDMKQAGIEVYTLSKTYNMAGWRVGFALGNAEVIRLINLYQDHYFVSLFGAVQMAAVEALTASQQCVYDLCAKYESRRNALYNALQRIGWQAKPSSGSFFAWLPVPDGYTSSSFADLLLNEAHVAVAPGVGFGAEGEGYVRVGLLVDEPRLEEAAERIAQLQLFR
ncbi:pyridoxal phosphate-dependent aminotransferase [Aneurinibacillus uraniidurans]|uniref:pyridoxal phosphate-dependent aminotransferase n=1 Tax=Aneurinibacillus uraniidurans TaxID=2966586 RepID=UPI00234997B5|nr:pyridoxal phosphate-dependent aminotransferase [Aneurinibacillus sp. B1]WCN36519.1 pyridoxal phosphate-dependent aminotransferase [Aneurinibacillus sp. B1]